MTRVRMQVIEIKPMNMPARHALLWHTQFWPEVQTRLVDDNVIVSGAVGTRYMEQLQMFLDDHRDHFVIVGCHGAMEGSPVASPENEAPAHETGLKSGHTWTSLERRMRFESMIANLMNSDLWYMIVHRLSEQHSVKVFGCYIDVDANISARISLTRMRNMQKGLTW